MPRAFRYSRWDGTQAGFELGPDEILAQVGDDVLYHGDVNAALRRLLQSGLHDRHGEPVAGLRELVERLRRRRQAELERYDLGGVYDDVAGELGEIVEQERAAVDSLERQARQSGDRRRQETALEVVAEHRLQLDLLPPDLAGQVRALGTYDFVSAEARERFDRLVEQLRRQLVQSQLGDLTRAMSGTGAEERRRLTDMLAALNGLLEQRARGETPDFDAFMSEFGDFFPSRPRSLDELLEQMAAQMAAFQSLVNSMTPEQRAQLQDLAASLLDDVDLQWQLDQLGRNLQGAFPAMGWGQAYDFTGDQGLGLLGASQLLDRLGQLHQLENLLSSAASPGALAEVDLDAARELLGDHDAASLERLAELARLLEEAGLIEQKEGRYELTARGVRRIGQNALGDIFTRLTADRLGRHDADREGRGQERTYDTKPYEFGEPFNLSIERTVRNAVHRAGGGVPVRLQADDFEVERTETLTRTSTVLMLDLSLSMPMRDSFLAAKKVAMALHALISARFPDDYLGIVGFSEVARALRPEQLPEVSWDFAFGTNIEHGLLLSRRLLAGQAGTRQIVMITDGEPTAHLLPGGDVFFHYPSTRETLEATLAEVGRCTRAAIRINTFMLDPSPHLRAFVERMSRLNRGRAFFTTPENLGDYVLVDFLTDKRSRRAQGRTA